LPLSSAQKQELTRHKQKLRRLVNKKGLKHKKLLLQRGGFLPALLAPVVSSLLPTVVGSIAKLFK